MKKKGDAVMSSGINQVLQGDCIETMEKLSDQDIDSIVTDPPYGLAFMGKDWDSFKPKEFQEFSQRWGEQAIRVLKPGGYLLAFSGTRTYHRMVTGLEDAGFIIKDQIDWLYGQGFPKSHNIKKSLMDLLDDEGKVVGKEEVDVGIQSGSMHAGRDSEIQEREVKKPTDERIKNLKLTGTALKPAHEPIVLAQKPYENSYAENVLKYGVGGLNIDGCRIGTEEDTSRPSGTDKNSNCYGKLDYNKGDMEEYFWPLAR